MKTRLLSVFLSLVLLLGAAVLPYTAAADTKAQPVINDITPGDVNTDGQITAADALMALQNAVGKITFTSDLTALANVDLKNGVTAADALLILQCGVGKIDGFGISDELAVTGTPYTENNVTYAVETAERELSEPITSFQEAASYTSSMDLPSDSVMVYIQAKSDANVRITGWEATKTDKSIDIMMAINRDYAGEYYSLYPDRVGKDSQTRKDGTPVVHVVDGDYMVPTETYIEYKWEVVKECLKHDIGYICFEEPEMFNVSGYSEGFKEEWKAFYGTDWIDQTESAEALYMTSKLKVHLFKRALETLATRIKEVKPDVKVYIASHSSINYTFHGIASSTETLANLDCVDGLIGQTWSDTARVGMSYNGGNMTDGFIESYLEYGTYAFNTEDKDVYSLADPCADANGFTWDEHTFWYQKTIVAQMMHAEIDRYELVAWASRSFAPAPSSYKTMQLNVFAAQTESAGAAATSYAGTPGIYIAQSDSICWQYGTEYMATSSSAASIYGMAVPLIEKGIPVKTVNLESVNSVDDLNGVKMLLLSYDCLKPQSEAVNTAISEWVKKGGILLYMGGHDAFETMDTEWWDKDTTPFENLLEKLDLNGVTVGSGTSNTASHLSFTGDGQYIPDATAYRTTSYNLAHNTATFAGSGYSAFLKNDDDTVGIEAAAGSGRVYIVGLPSAYYSQVSNGATLMREITEYALSKSPLQYLESNLMLTKQGNVIAAQALYENQNLYGSFIDLFDSTLPIISEKTLYAKGSSLLYDISELKKASTPVLAFCSGDSKVVSQTADKTVFTVSSPSTCTLNARLLGNGKYFESVTVTRGESKVNAIPMWDKESESVLISFAGDTQEAEITVNWGDDPNVNTPNYEFTDIKVMTNSKNEDAAYIYDNNAHVNGNIRFTDLGTHVTYKFDLDTYLQATVSLDIFQNYRVDIADSPDGPWTKVADYSDISSTPITTGDNWVDLLVDPATYGCTGDFYIRLSHAFPSPTAGWGGSIRSFTITYLKEIQE